MPDFSNIGTGNTYSSRMGDTTTSASITSAGVFSFDQKEQDEATTTTSINLTLPSSVDASAFPKTLPQTAATGSLDYEFIGRGGYFVSYQGDVTSLRVLGQVAGIQATNAFFLPEPATWAMVILGVGAIGATMRRRVRPAPLLA